MPFTAAEIAKQVGGEVIGDPCLLLTGFAPADRAKAGDLTFAENESYFARADQSAASAILIDGPFTSTRKLLIRVTNARIAYAKVLPLFVPEQKFEAEFEFTPERLLVRTVLGMYSMAGFIAKCHRLVT